MQISVGSTLKYSGTECVCTRIEKRESTSFARHDQLVMESELRNSVNCKFLQLELDVFEEGDVITTECEWVELTSPGTNLFFIYTVYKVRKEEIKSDGQQRDQTVDKAAGSDKAEADRGGIGGGEGAGEKSVGENSDPVHPDGQAGEGGIAVRPGEGEGAEHSET